MLILPIKSPSPIPSPNENKFTLLDCWYESPNSLLRDSKSSLLAINRILSPSSRTVSPVATISTSPLLIRVIMASNFSSKFREAMVTPVTSGLETNILLRSYLVLSLKVGETVGSPKISVSLSSSFFSPTAIKPSPN